MLIAVARDAWLRSDGPMAFTATVPLPPGTPGVLLLARHWDGPRTIQLLGQDGTPKPIMPETHGELVSATVPPPGEAGGMLRVSAGSVPGRLWLLRAPLRSPSASLLPVTLRSRPAATRPPLTSEALLAHLEAEGLGSALGLVASRWLEGEDVEAVSAVLLRHLGERPFLRSPLLGTWAALLARA